MKKLILTALTCAVIAGPALAATKTHTVDKMRYHNGGAYVAYFNVRYNLDDGTNCTVYIDNQSKTLADDTNVTVDLTSHVFRIKKGPGKCLDDRKIPAGEQVWGKVSIEGGEDKSCREKDSILVVGDGGKTVEYETKGTTTEGNSCKQLNP